MNIHVMLYLFRIRLRNLITPFFAFKFKRELETIKNIIASKDGRLTETDCEVLRISREALDSLSRKVDWITLRER